jgi:hypothetical protein
MLGYLAWAADETVRGRYDPQAYQERLEPRVLILAALAAVIPSIVIPAIGADGDRINHVTLERPGDP